MKFSFSLIKSLAPGRYDKAALVAKLNAFSFEAADAGGDALDISVPPNRYSDAASHLGIAREAAMIFGSNVQSPVEKKFRADSKQSGVLRAAIQERSLCSRYATTYVSNITIGPSPASLKKTLETCGIRSINNVVDVMNYVMLELGQPMHAFDADKIKGGLVVRRAKKEEAIETLEGDTFKLDPDTLVIADTERPLAIAGIKGGRFAEVSRTTKHIIIEAATFDSTTVYKTTRRLGLATDASARFAHRLSPELVMPAMQRALQLLQEISDAKIYTPIDVYPKPQAKRLVKISPKDIQRLIGRPFTTEEINNTLKKLGFAAVKKMWAIPPLRIDIDDSEDVAEEIARYSGYENLTAVAPSVALGVAREEEKITFQDTLRSFFKGAGLNEVYNYTFVSESETRLAPIGALHFDHAVALANPISKQYDHLRDSLAPGLVRVLKDNSRFYDEVRVFEIGHIFGAVRGGSIQERLTLGIALSSKQSVLELKGLLDALFGQLGLSDYLMPDLHEPSKIINAPSAALRIETAEHEVIGYIGALKGVRNGAVAEIDIDRLLAEVDGEREYEPLSKYPSVIRDISLLVNQSVRVGEILSLLQSVSPKLVNDVDLIDFYEDEKLGDNRKSLTFRIIFQADDRTLTDAEVDKEMAIISKVLEDRFNVEIR